jgi:erythromycin esterase-like protein
MVQTINNIMKQHGPEAKIVVWEHNTHIGDARATDMAAAGEVNVGQLVREQHGTEGVYTVGFGTYQGSVIAARNWGATPQKMKVPAGKPGSWEALLHQVAPANKLVITKGLKVNKALLKRKGHRAIGVVYHPESENGNYVPTSLPQRYDALLFIDQTQALHPLPVQKPNKKSPVPNVVTATEGSDL